jgi:2-oxoglutarate ferredoxin oxidoreductase subunit alpha
LHFGTSTDATMEAIDYLTRDGLAVDSCRIRAFPFNQEIEDFIDSHRTVFVVEQNRDAQMRSLLVNDCEINPKHLIPVLNYDGMPITASFIQGKIVDYMDRAKVTPLRKDSANDNTANL